MASINSSIILSWSIHPLSFPKTLEENVLMVETNTMRVRFPAPKFWIRYIMAPGTNFNDVIFFYHFLYCYPVAGWASPNYKAQEK